MKKFAIPEGTRDLILGECTAKKRLQAAIEQVFDSYGYKEIVTPSIEFYQTYQTGFEQIQEEAMYKFFDHNGSILTLRMDMTVPIARVAATKFKDQQPPLRFRYCANVYKVKESFAGKRNEVTDCGIELLGLNEEQSDLEILVCALEVMECMEQEPFTLEIGNVNFFHTAVKLLGLTKDETETLADLIDRKSLTELKEYLNTLNLKAEDKQFFLQLPWLCGSADMLQEALDCCFDERLQRIVENLQQLYEQLRELGYENRITFDLGKLPHLNYYSGILFEGFVPGIGTSVLSGGRYDSLLEKFGEPLPAIGFSVKLDAVLPVLHLKQKEATLTLCYPYARKVEALRKAKELRKTARVELLCGAYDDIIVKGENNA